MSVGHWNRPPSRLHPSAVGHEIDERRDHHAADRCGNRQCGPARGRQFAGKRLAFNLQPDKEKKDGHESIVNPLMNGERQLVPSHGDGERYRPQVVVGVSPRRISRDKRDDSAGDKQPPSGRLRLEEFLKGARGAENSRLNRHPHTLSHRTAPPHICDGGSKIPKSASAARAPLELTTTAWIRVNAIRKFIAARKDQNTGCGSEPHGSRDTRDRPRNCEWRTESGAGHGPAPTPWRRPTRCAPARPKH